VSTGRLLWDAACDLLLAPACAGCAAAAGGGVLCRGCRARICPAPVLVRPAAAPAGSLPATTAACRYEGPVRRLLLAYKEQGRLAAAWPLATLLVAAVEAAAGPSAAAGGHLLLVPVPSRPGMRRRRGHDPVGRLAVLASRRLSGASGAGAVRAVPLLRHRGRVVDQAGLSSADRWHNLDGALALHDPGNVLAAPGTLVVLVDDVCSSGATLAAAAAALRPTAARVVAAVVAAPALERDRWPVPLRSGSD